jgi:hypothetical protein
MHLNQYYHPLHAVVYHYSTASIHGIVKEQTNKKTVIMSYEEPQDKVPWRGSYFESKHEMQSEMEHCMIQFNSLITL